MARKPSTFKTTPILGKGRAITVKSNTQVSIKRQKTGYPDFDRHTDAWRYHILDEISHTFDIHCLAVDRALRTIPRRQRGKIRRAFDQLVRDHYSGANRRVFEPTPLKTFKDIVDEEQMTDAEAKALKIERQQETDARVRILIMLVFKHNWLTAREKADLVLDLNAMHIPWKKAGRKLKTLVKHRKREKAEEKANRMVVDMMTEGRLTGRAQYKLCRAFRKLGV